MAVFRISGSSRRALLAAQGAFALVLASGALVFASGAFAQAQQPAAQSSVLTPHRATYDLSLLKAEGRNAPAGVQGRIVYEFNGNACEGYTTNFRQITEMAPAEGPVRLADMRSTTFESGDGALFRFRIETLTNGSRTKLIEGAAERSGGTLSVVLRQPAPQKADLAEEALFPVQQTLRGLAAARAGENAIEFKVYDGSADGMKIYHSLNIVGQPLSRPAGDAAAETAVMKDTRRWPLIASYFDQNKGDSKPVYTLSFELWENGVSSNLKLDYGDFILAGKLSKLELLKATPCDKPAK